MGLYHVHPCSSSCFPAPQQAFVGEMGQKRRLVAASSYVFEKGRNFSKQVGHWDPRSRPRAEKQAFLSPDRGRENNGARPFAQAAGTVDVLFCKSVGAVGLYHVHPCSSSCFPAPQQAFVGEMGQRRASLAWSSTFFENGRNFSKQVERWDPRPGRGAARKAPLNPGRRQGNKSSTARPREQ